MNINIDTLIYKGTVMLGEEFEFTIHEILAILLYVEDDQNDKNKQLIGLYLLSCQAPQVEQKDIDRLAKLISARMTKEQIKSYVTFLKNTFTLLKHDLVANK